MIVLYKHAHDRTDMLDPLASVQSSSIFLLNHVSN
jgi:hypothetical protein